jgi:hypothetical protein
MVNGRLPGRRRRRPSTEQSRRRRRSPSAMIRGLDTIAANFTQLAIIRIFRKNATHSRRISEKSAFPGELAFQTPLLGSPQCGE